MDPKQKMKLKIGGGVALVIGLAILFRWLQLLPYPQGDYNYINAPFGNYRAYLYREIDFGFFGGERSFCRYKVEMQHPSIEGQWIVIREEDIPLYLITRDIEMFHLDKLITWDESQNLVTLDVGTRTYETRLPF